MSPAVTAPYVRQVTSLSCPNCGATVALRGFGLALNAVCGSCQSVLDASNSQQVQILQKAESWQTFDPVIPLGRRGTFRGEAWEAIGFQRRAIVVEGATYAWFEYLLFNPYRGFRYLTEYDGHWTWIRPVSALPRQWKMGGRLLGAYGGKTFKHFQTATARTTFVLGEFPFQVRVGDTVEVNDFTSPPYSIGSERSEQEVSWSAGEYVSADEIWRCFGVPGKAPAGKGVYFNQPNPHAEKPKRYWTWSLIGLAVWLLITVGLVVMSPNREVFRQQYVFDPLSRSERAFVTDLFELRESGKLELEVASNVDQAELDLDVALIEYSSGTAYNVGVSTSYYYGNDSDGSWSEGSREARASLGRVPAGRYYFRIEPEAAAESNSVGSRVPLRYTLVARQDKPGVLWMLCAVLFLFLPPLWVSIEAGGFETARWQESDYAVAAGGEEEAG